MPNIKITNAHNAWTRYPKLREELIRIHRAHNLSINEEVIRSRAWDLGLSFANGGTSKKWEDTEAYERSLLPTVQPPPPSPDMTYGNHRGNFLYEFFGPAQVGHGETRLRAYFQRLKNRGDTDVLLNAEQDDWMGREGHPEWGSGFSVYSDNPEHMNYFVRMLDVAWQEYGLRPHVGIIDQPTLRSFYDYDTHMGWSIHETSSPFSSVKGRTQYLMNAIKGKATLVMPSWECGEVMSDGSRKSHEVMEERLVEWATWIHEIDPQVWVGIHHADGLRGGNNFYGALGRAVGHRGCRYMQYDQADTDADIENKTYLIIDVAERTGTSICVMEHSSPVRLGRTYTEEEAKQRAQVAGRILPSTSRFQNFMNGY